MPVRCRAIGWPKGLACFQPGDPIGGQSSSPTGVAVVYSQARSGPQKRLVATTGIVRNRPLFIPDIMSLPNIDIEPPHPGNWRVRDGRRSMQN